MYNTLVNKKDLVTKYNNRINVQDYSRKSDIEGVKIINLSLHSGEDGYFIEFFKFDKENFSQVYDFKLQQINMSQILPGVIKAWHIHLNQEDIWFVRPEDQLLVGLFDLRKKSPTNGQKMRLTLGNHKSMLLLIPRGVAHGCANISQNPTTLIYLVNKQFDSKNPDEYRLPWDNFGKDFWETTKG